MDYFTPGFPQIMIALSIGIIILLIIYHRKNRRLKRIARMMLDGKFSPSSTEGFNRLLSDLAAMAKHDKEIEYLWHKLEEKREIWGKENKKTPSPYQGEKGDRV